MISSALSANHDASNLARNPKYRSRRPASSELTESGIIRGDRTTGTHSQGHVHGGVLQHKPLTFVLRNEKRVDVDAERTPKREMGYRGGRQDLTRSAGDEKMNGWTKIWRMVEKQREQGDKAALAGVGQTAAAVVKAITDWTVATRFVLMLQPPQNAKCRRRVNAKRHLLKQTGEQNYNQDQSAADVEINDAAPLRHSPENGDANK
ncbi:hypothetical protein BOTBODRAFT_40972 [Botryobasidium botryosum FD-172 SS1]|uniref:Uncharacterized protein n=1 Tax=Botryobasidium botryosum (strain FD-172 SS1) TaxID=930990 RepID=A0A067MZC4_BOTB1|nr:hypothetical protein BOTBODRAFT_40972 [Botryobasidium botryosum FD-172 SS1]